MEVETSSDEVYVQEEQRVTVEVVPQTVNDIIYICERDGSYYPPSEEEMDSDSNGEMYEIGSVDPAAHGESPLVLDETESFVLLSQDVPYSYKEMDDDYSEEQLKKKSRFTMKTYPGLIKKPRVHKDPQNEYVCNICNVKFTRPQALSHHFRVSHEQPKLTCSICGCPCATENALMGHYRTHEPKQFNCTVCNAEYDSECDLLNHRKTHTNTPLYACNKCDLGFETTAAVSAHLRDAHPKCTYVKLGDNLTYMAEAASVCVSGKRKMAKAKEESCNRSFKQKRR